MSSDDSLPRIDRCVTLYLTVWDLFEDRSFTPEELTRRLIQHDRAIDATTGSSEPRVSLDLLVAYGLLERVEADTYRIRCAPDADVDQWERDRRSQLQRLHERVQQRKRQPNTDPAEAPAAEGCLRRRGETFSSLRVEADSTFQDVSTAIVDRSDRESDTAGIVLRSPADLAGQVQQLSDDLCSAETTTDRAVPRFEKVTSDVVGEHKDDLEYRLYLRRVR